MQPVWKILAPVDLNERTGAVVEHAIDVARATAAELVLLHVLDGGVHRDARKVGRPPEAMGGAQGPSVNLQRVVLPGDAFPGDAAARICRYADFINANVVLMTSRSRGWRRLWRGSITAEVLDSTHRPVQVTSLDHIDSDYRYRCRRILCVLALDGSDDPIIECAGTLATRTGAEIALLHVLPETSEGLLAWGLAQSDRPLSRAVALDRIHAFRDVLPAPYVTEILTGASHNEIRMAAGRLSADVILVGRARPGVWAPACPDPRAILRQAPCPVLSVPVSNVVLEAPPVRRYRRPARENVLCDI